MFADNEGRVGYTLVGDFPVCGCGTPLAGMTALDGSTSNSQWLALMPQDHLPWVIKESKTAEMRFVASANNVPCDDTFPIPLISHGGQTDRYRRLLELLEALALDVDGQSVAYFMSKASDVEHMSEDGVLVGVRDLVRVAKHLRDNHSLIKGPDAHLALVILEAWADPGVNAGELAPQGVGMASESALALYARAPFRSSNQGGPVPEGMILKYGSGDLGLNHLLEELVTTLELPGEPCVGKTCKDFSRFVNLALRTGLERVQLESGHPSSWDAFHISDLDQGAGTLTREVPVWTGLEALEGDVTWPALEASPPSVYGPVNVASGLTLYNQSAQTYLQWVELAPGSVSARSMLAPGQAEDPASPHSHDQVDLWHVGHDEDQVHKQVALDKPVFPDPPWASTLLGYDHP